MPNIQDVANTNTDPFSLFSCLFPGIFGPFAQTDSHLHWMSFFSNPFNTQNHLSWVGWYLQKNQMFFPSMWNPPNRNGKPLWRDGQVETLDHEIPQFWIYVKHDIPGGLQSKNMEGLVMQTWKKHLLGRGRGYYNLPIYFLESLVSTVLPKC